MKNASLSVAGALLVAAGAAWAQPSSPVYTNSVQDCTTADNRITGPGGEFWWFVDAGCDRYQIDVYERPTTQEYQNVYERYAAKEAFEYLDITRARHGFDDRFLYIAIDLFGRDHLTSDGDRDEKGMIERYGFRFSTDPDGRNGLLVVSDQPEVKNEPNTRYGPLGTFAYRDTNRDVGGAARSGPTGLNVTKSDNPNEESGMNGYDQVVISDGRMENEQVVLWVRLSPTDDTIVEFALDYRAMGYTTQYMQNLRYLDFEAIKGGPKDPQNYLWNDKYTKEEAGSPNKGQNGRSEFGTVGLQNIYECDTVRADLTGCYADCDQATGPGVLDIFDFLCFGNRFSSNDPYACNCDTSTGQNVCDIFDYICFQNAFAAGCP